MELYIQLPPFRSNPLSLFYFSPSKSHQHLQLKCRNPPVCPTSHIISHKNSFFLSTIMTTFVPQVKFSAVSFNNYHTITLFVPCFISVSKEKLHSFSQVISEKEKPLNWLSSTRPISTACCSIWYFRRHFYIYPLLASPWRPPAWVGFTPDWRFCQYSSLVKVSWQNVALLCNHK